MIFLPSYRVLVVILLCLLMWAGECMGQAVVTDQVSITAERDIVFAIMPGEGFARQRLTAGEQIIVMEAKGVTGFVHTSIRLLGFSGDLGRWVEIRVAPSDNVLAWTVTPRMVIVQGHDGVYGFQTGRARWKREAWGAGEDLLDFAIEDHVALFVTTRRAVAFSAFTGGFFSEDLPVRAQVSDIQINDNIAILHLSDRKLVFRSGLAIWAVLP